MTVWAVPANDVRVVCVVTVATDGAFRRGVRKAISALPELRAVGEAADAISAAVLTALGKPDLVIVDALMPWAEASDVIRHIRAAAPETRIMACTDTPDMGLAEVGLTVGTALAHGGREELVSALRRRCGESRQLR